MYIVMRLKFQGKNSIKIHHLITNPTANEVSYSFDGEF